MNAEAGEARRETAMISPDERLQVVVWKLRRIRERLDAVYDRSYGPRDRVQALIDLLVTNDLPFLIDYAEGGPGGRRLQASRPEGD